MTCDSSGGNPNPLVIPPPSGSVTLNIQSGAQLNNIDIGAGNTITDLTVNNNGQINGQTTITVTGPGDSVFNNNGPITFSGAAVTIHNNNTTGGAFTFHQGSSQPISNLVMDGTGNNSVIVNANTSITNLVMSGARLYVDNSGTTTNQTLSLNGTVSNYVINRQNAWINSNSFSGPNTIIDNYGTFNSTINFVGVNPTDRNTVFNQGTGRLANGITATGPSREFVDNQGVINGDVNLGPGNDYFANHLDATTGPGIDTNNVNLGTGDDTFWMTGGTINGTVNFGDGVDQGFMTGGTITAPVQGGAGNDDFTWTGGNFNAGMAMDMGADDDRVFLESLPAANLTNFLQLNGGTGNDALIWTDTTGGAVGRFLQWERIELTEGSQMIFSDGSPLTLGDSGSATGTGQLLIDSTSSVLAGGGTRTVQPSGSGQLVNIYNAGAIDLTNGAATNNDRFIVLGNYTGLDGALNIQTNLGSDGAPSDQLVIRGAGASGSGATLLYVSNLNGAGDATSGDGIRVIDADGGAITGSGTFALGGPVAAGIYEYQLFQGGITANSANDNDWFLRSSVPGTTPPVPPDPQPVTPVLPPVPPPVEPPTPEVPPPTPEPPDPGEPGPTPEPPPPVDPPTPPPPLEPPPVVPPGPGAVPPPAPPLEQTPLIRPEIPSYTLVPGIAQQIGLAAIGTFHERQGDQFLLNNFGSVSSAWARLLGESREQQWNSFIGNLDYDLGLRFDGDIWGVQAGLDLWAEEHDDGSQDRFGLFYTHSAANGDVEGNVLADKHVQSGRLDIDGDGVGINWTHIGADDWYLDVVAMETWFYGDAGSDRGIKADIDGRSFLASVEGGYPVPVADGWAIEPEA